MKPRGRFYSLLSVPAVYRVFRALVRGGNANAYMTEYVKPVAGEKVLDIGCGPGEILEELPAVDYLGFDISTKYIEAALKRYGQRGRFFCGDVGLTTIDAEAGSFDVDRIHARGKQGNDVAAVG